MGKYDDNIASSGDSSSKAAQAEHDARKHATDADLFKRGDDSKNSKPFSKDDESGRQATGFWNSIFGSKK